MFLGMRMHCCNVSHIYWGACPAVNFHREKKVEWSFSGNRDEKEREKERKKKQENDGCPVLKLVPCCPNTGGIQYCVTVWAAV